MEKWSVVKENETGRYDSIQLMRGIAALSVVCVHIGMINQGHYGVELFFIISGFVIMHATEKKYQLFMIRRLIRVLPLYWLATLANYLPLLIMPETANRIFDGKFLALSLLLTPNFEMEAGLGLDYYVALHTGWTLIIEVLFYALFWLSMKVYHKYRHIICTAVILILAVAGVVINSDNIFFRFITSPFLINIAVGMLSYKLLLCTSLKNWQIKGNMKMLGVGSAILLLAMMFMIKYIPILNGMHRLIRFTVPSWIFFVIVFKMFQGKKLFRPFVLLGNISYSIYLLHPTILSAVDKLIFNLDYFSVGSLCLVIGIVLPCIVLISGLS